MIREKLYEIELDIKHNIYKEQKILKSVQSIKELLNQIDFDAEKVPIEDVNKLTDLLILLKGEQLNEEENKLIEKIVQNK